MFPFFLHPAQFDLRRFIATRELLARVRTHMELKQTRDELQKIIAEKNERMSAVAHDLKNPLSAMRLSALMLRTPRSPDGSKELVESFVECCDGMHGFIRERLERSARESHGGHLNISNRSSLMTWSPAPSSNSQVGCRTNTDRPLSHILARNSRTSDLIFRLARLLGLKRTRYDCGSNEALYNRRMRSLNCNCPLDRHRSQDLRR